MLTKWLFPVGAILTLSTVPIEAALEAHGAHSTEDRLATVLLLMDRYVAIGIPLTFIGAVADLRRLSLAQARTRGWLCWLVAVLSFWWFIGSGGNIHSWTGTLLYPAFTAFGAGAIYLSKYIIAKVAANWR